MTENRIIIPELEEIIDTNTNSRVWLPEDIRAVRDYYGRVPTKNLAKHLKRTTAAVIKKAEYLGITVTSQQEKARAEKKRGRK